MIAQILELLWRRTKMAANHKHSEITEDEEECVLLDFDDVSGQVNIPPGTPYVLTGLDTLNPILIIGDNVRLIGEYQETVGTCLVFSEKDAERPVVMMHPETGPSEMNLFKETCIVDQAQEPSKQVQPIASLHKILKFRLAAEDGVRKEPNKAKV